jgi:3-oxoacyl-[acyl-carrier protein] reductase
MSKTIVVAGASRGIGLQVVKQFARDPDNRVICFSRSFAQGTLEGFPSIETYPLDLTSENVRQHVETLLSEIPEIDILINNAGYIVVKPFLELTHEEIATAYQVNIISVMETIQACLPKMKPGAHIVSISSMGGFQGSMKFAGLAAYSTSKAAVASLTELLAEELKETGIKINCLCLGSVQTEMLETAFPGYKALLQPEEMAGYICDFALNAHRFMHGRIIPVSLTTP